MEEPEKIINKLIRLPTHFSDPVNVENIVPINAKQLSLFVESHRIRYAYSYDPYFAVSLSGIQTLPHQLEKKRKKYHLRDYLERGQDEKLGLDGKTTIDILHRLLWLLENQVYKIPEYLSQAMPNYGLLKLTAQGLAGTTLTGSKELIATTSDEKSLLLRLLANWKSLIDEQTLFRRL